MKLRFQHSLQIVLSLLDVIAINIAYSIVFYAFSYYGLIQKHAQYSYLVLLINFAWLITALFTGLYAGNIILSFELFTKTTVRNYLVFLLLLVVGLFFFRMLMLSRIFIVAIFFAIPLLLMLNRLIYTGIFLYLKNGGRYINKILIIGYNNLSKKVTALLEEEGRNKEIIGYCEEYQNIHELSHYPILCPIEKTMEACMQYGITEIYSTVAPEHNKVVYNLMQSADQSCIRFKIVPDLGIFTKKQMHIAQLKGLPVISMRKEPLEDVNNKLKKRLTDLIVSGLVITLILSWLIPVLSLLIWIESRGSVFFIQERTGKNNKNFRCIKFRSMYVNDSAHSKQATRDDERITKIGSFLRRTSLDEFPQFINVFKGQMSIVGPRPHMIKHTDEYSRSVNQYMVRQFLKPGITGWAQVNGYRGETSNILQMEKRVEHDLWYLENWSLLLDLRIIFLTVINSITGDSNAF